jgi:peptidoglycan/xylan/chitin deacetylase (PgdA/CDA1 family)
VDAGHQISNHTMTHPLNLPRLTTTQVLDEIVGCYDRISQTTGVAPKFFRSPGGNWSTAVLETAAEHGMTAIDWSIDPRDWDQPRSTTEHISQVLSTARPGDILLSHDGGGIRYRTIEALRTVIPALQARGYTFIAL